MHTFFGLLVTPFLRLEYYLGAWFEFLGFFFKAQTWSRRLSCRVGSWPRPPCQIDRLAIFAAFHGPEVTLSNLGYVNCLKEAGFQVVYVHNGPISTNSLERLRPLCVAVLERVNLGQDFGSYKDAYLCLKRFGWLDSVDWLLFCNDSLHFLGGHAGSSFSSLLSQKLSEIDEPVLALNDNLQFWKHVQSYFVAVRSEVFNSSRFQDFWKSYLPLSHRYHAINKGEVRLSLRILNNFPCKILYTPSDLASFALAALADKKSSGVPRLFIPKSCHGIVDNIPTNSSVQIPINDKSSSDFMSSDLAATGIVCWDQLLVLIGILEGTNVSHSCALMFPAFLGAPFVKKDICRHNVYTIVQVRQFLDYYFRVNLGASTSLLSEIISSFEAQGAYVSYRFRLRVALRKGLMYRGFGIPRILLPNYGNR
jgi:hypothetical protein